MYKILNQEKETVAYIQNMMILNKKREKVIGLVIGDCFFGNDNKVIGKIIDPPPPLLNGDIIGTIETNKDKKESEPKKGHGRRNFLLLCEKMDILEEPKYLKAYKKKNV